MSAGNVSPFGYVTIFGITKDLRALEHKLPDRLGIVPRTIDLGRAGHFFFYTSYGETAETEQVLALKLGFVRTQAKEPLSVQELLVQRLITPAKVASDDFRGNALVACFSKVEARFSVFKTLISGPPLYYSISDGIVVCSDRLRCLVEILDDLELDESALPQHFLLLGTFGSKTYFRNIQRLQSGECIRWSDGVGQVRLIKDFRSFRTDPTYGRIDARSPQIYERLEGLIGAYVTDIQRSGAAFGNLLSGGVDSSLTQLLINEHFPQVRQRSFSYRVCTPGFESEVEYAKRAQLDFDTEHVFVDILPQDYPDILIRSIEILGQPVHSAMEPCKLALAEHLVDMPDSPLYFFVAQGADGLFGSSMAQKIKMLELLGRIPAADSILRRSAKLLIPFKRYQQKALKAAEVLKNLNHLAAPINIVSINSDFDFAIRCFGIEAVEQVFEQRRGLEAEYLGSQNYMERVYITNLLSTTHSTSTQSLTLFMANNKQQLYPFIDEDAVRISFAVKPERRYIRRFRTKPILKDLLAQRSSSPAPRLPKLGSSFNADLCRWMDGGPLHDIVKDIERPDFFSRADFKELMKRPNYYFLWALLTFDIFKKRVIGARV